MIINKNGVESIIEQIGEFYYDKNKCEEHTITNRFWKKDLLFTDKSTYQAEKLKKGNLFPIISVKKGNRVPLKYIGYYIKEYFNPKFKLKSILNFVTKKARIF